MSEIAVREIQVKTVLTPSGISGLDYSLNPYVGCAHGCAYCYADFMRRFSGHTEPWGTFVDIKRNAPELLRAELARKRPGVIGLSLVTDPYQPLEKTYGLTRRCLETLLDFPEFSLTVLTRSTLVLRDIDLLRRLARVEVGLSVTTDDDRVRRLFEPRAPTIGRRLAALRRLREAGLKTYAFVGPLLPMDPAHLARLLIGRVDYIYLDRMNYPWKSRAIHQRHGLSYALTDGFFESAGRVIRAILGDAGIPCRPD